ncbi:hypothetical protein BJ742DRAFT_873626 [Cladochytrium replicatum]|nr:hypothetical protein BJ742DRAFT_873626 [Cladochytrium replicatum]
MSSSGRTEKDTLPHRLGRKVCLSVGQVDGEGQQSYMAGRPTRHGGRRSGSFVCRYAVLIFAAFFISLPPPSICAVEIKGTGASFPSALYQEWTQIFSQLQRNVKEFTKVTYSPQSSYVGANAVQSGAANFGGADVIYEDVDLTDVAVVPVVAGAIVIAYRVPEARNTRLILTRQNVVQIFNGTITTWNDPRLTQLNPVLANVSNRIKLILRAPGSGTTVNLRLALNSFDPSYPPVWVRPLDGPNAVTNVTDDFPWLPNTDNKVTVRTSADVASFMQYDNYVLGYMDLRDAGTASYATLVNRRGMQVDANVASVQAAMAAATAATVSNSSLGFNTVIYDRDAPNAYPICAYTYYYVRKSNFNLTSLGEDSNEVLQIRWTLRYLYWTITSGTPDSIAQYNSTAGIEYRPSIADPIVSDRTARKAAIDAKFVPLSDSVRAAAISILRSIKLDTNTTLYGASPCDYPSGSSNGCEADSICRSQDAFQTSSAVCICKPPRINVHGKRCQEDATVVLIDDTNRLVILSLVLFVIGTIICLSIWFGIWFYRDHPLIKSITPVCCYVIMFGCCVGLLGQLLQTFLPTDSICSMRLFLPPLAFGIVFGMLFMKTYRIFLIFGYKRVSLEERTMTNSTLIALTSAIAVFEFIYCIPWLIITFPRATIDLQLSENRPVCAPAAGKGTIHMGFEIGIYVFNGILGAMTTYLAIRTRHAFERFRESRSIGVAVYSVAMTSLLGIAIIYGLPKVESFLGAANFVTMAVIFLCSTVTPIILYGPRLLEVVFNRPDSPKSFRDARLKYLARPSDRQNHHHQKSSDNKLEGAKSAASEVDGEQLTSIRNLAIQAVLYEVGVRAIRFGSVWQSLTLLVIPELDMMLLVDNLTSFKIIAGMKLSAASCTLDSTSTVGDASLPPTPTPLRRSSTVRSIGSMSQRSGRSTAQRSTTSASILKRLSLDSGRASWMAGEGRMVLVRANSHPNLSSSSQTENGGMWNLLSAVFNPSGLISGGGGKGTYLIEFSSHTRAHEFMTIHTLVQRRAGMKEDMIRMPSTPSFLTTNPEMTNDDGAAQSRGMQSEWGIGSLDSNGLDEEIKNAPPMPTQMLAQPPPAHHRYGSSDDRGKGPESYELRGTVGSQGSSGPSSATSEQVILERVRTALMHNRTIFDMVGYRGGVTSSSLGGNVQLRQRKTLTRRAEEEVTYPAAVAVHVGGGVIAPTAIIMSPPGAHIPQQYYDYDDEDYDEDESPEERTGSGSREGGLGRESVQSSGSEQHSHF